MRWIAIGDIHEQTGMLARIPGLAEADGVLISGDLTNRGTAGAARAVIEAVQSFNPNVRAVMGNMDTQKVADYLTKQGIYLHLAACDLASPGLTAESGPRPRVGAIGVGYSTPTPFATPSEVSDDQLASWLDQVWKLTKPYDHVVAVIHTPPLDTKADDLGSGTHVGSRAVRGFIEKHAPAVVITGHIHEAKSVDHIGSTTIINPGMLAHGGYVAVTADGSRVRATLEQV